MKKIVLCLTVFCLFAFVGTNAQMTKGRILVGLTSTIHLSEVGPSGTDLLGLGYVKTSDPDGDSYNTTYFNLLPRGGYFVIDNLVVGLDIVISSSKEKDPESDSKYTSSMLAAGPFVRYYYPLEKVYPFAELGISFGSHKDNWSYGGADDKETYTATNFGGGIGAAFPLGDMVTFDVMAGYTHLSFTDKTTAGDPYKVKSGAIGLKMGFTVFFGPK